MTTTVRDPVDAALAELGGQLPGASRFRADLLAEIEAELRHAQRCFAAAGRSAVEAAESAIAEFGDIAGLAAELRVELATRSARHTAILLAAGYPLMSLLWSINAAIAPPTNGSPAPSWVTGSFTVIELLAVALAATLALTLRATRDGRRVALLLTALASVSTIAGAGTLIASLLTNVLSTVVPLPGNDRFFQHVVEGLSGAFILATGYAAARCLRLRHVLVRVAPKALSAG